MRIGATVIAALYRRWSMETRHPRRNPRAVLATELTKNKTIIGATGYWVRRYFLEPSNPDLQLIRQCRLGSRASWHELLQRFTPPVYRITYRVLQDTEEARDATQEVFVRVHRSLGTFDESRPLLPWLSKIAYRAALRRLKNVSEIVASDVDALRSRGVEPANSESPEQLVAKAEAYDVVARAFESLAPEERALLHMRYREGLTDSALAQITGLPLGTVKTRLYRARMLLRESLRTIRGALS